MTEPTPIILSSPDTGSRGAGDALRRAREAQGMTLEALASMIKVTPGKLDALEQGRYEELPDANFTRALAMTVCRALKVDPTDVLAGLPAARPTALAEGRPPLNQPFKEGKGVLNLFDHHGLNWRALWMPRYVAPILLLVGAVVIYALPDSIDAPDWLSRLGSTSTQRVAPPVPVPSSPAVQADAASSPVGGMPSSGAASGLQLDPVEAAGAAASSGVAPAGEGPASSASGMNGAAPGPAATVAVDPRLGVPTGATSMAPAETMAAANASSALSASAASSGPLRMAITQPSWIEVKDAQGRKLYSALAKPGEELVLDGPLPLQVRIGHVAGVQLRFKGQPVDLSSFARNNVARLELK
ncbi:MAG: helix-turn-helix domain-containing protein [Aquabacterium sp.]